MIQIHPDQVPTGFFAMFQCGTPIGIRTQVVLAGGNTGKVFTDDPQHPHWGLVWEPDIATIDALFNQEQLYCVITGICPFRMYYGFIC